MDLLTEEEYITLANKLYEFRDKYKLKKYLEKIRAKYSNEDVSFWPNLYTAFKEHAVKFQMWDTEIELISSGIHEITHLENEKEKQVYIDDLLTKHLEVYTESRQLKNLIFKLEDFPLIDSRLQKTNNASGISTKYYINERSILISKLLNVAYNGSFEKRDITEGMDKEALKTLVKYYFKVFAKKRSSSPENEKVFFNVNIAVEDIAYKTISIEETKKVFSRMHKNVSEHKKNSASNFSYFQSWEIARWKVIQGRFDVRDSEWHLLKRYLYHLRNLTKKDLDKSEGESKSFGIDVKCSEALRLFLTHLNKEINFIDTSQKGNSIGNAVDVLTSNNYLQPPNKIYLGCKTTTAVWILNLINDKFSDQSRLNQYAIGKSKCFLVSFKKHSNRLLHSKEDKFIHISRENFAQSLRRFNMYKQEMKEPEIGDFNKIIPIFKKTTIANTNSHYFI